MSRGALWLAWLAAVLAAGGCGRRDSTKAPAALTPPQESAAKQYLPLLDQQIGLVEQSAAILATVGNDTITKDAARARLLQLSIESEALEQRLRDQMPVDVTVIAAARQRVAGRQQQAARKLLVEVHRVNAMPGGEDFFQKELRPLLQAAKGR
jgi:hypothetical protein